MTQPGKKLADLRILVAEDEARLADLLVELIALHGGTVAGPVASAEDASAIIDGDRVDGAVLDVHLQSGPCFMLAEALMRRRIPVVLITGYARSDIPQSLVNLPTFTKPFSVETLVQCLADCCRRGAGGG